MVADAWAVEDAPRDGPQEHYAKQDDGGDRGGKAAHEPDVMRRSARVDRMAPGGIGRRSAGGRSAAARRAPGEVRDIAALGDVDEDRVGQAGDEIVVLQRPAQPPGLDAHDRVALGVELRVAPEHLHPDRVGLDALGAPGERLLDDVAQEPARPRGRVEIGAGEEAVELGAHVLGRRRRLRLRRATDNEARRRAWAGPFPWAAEAPLSA